MAFTGITWGFQQDSTRCSKSSRIHWLETNFHRYAQRFGVFLYPSHPDGSTVLHRLCRRVCEAHLSWIDAVPTYVCFAFSQKCMKCNPWLEKFPCLWIVGIFTTIYAVAAFCVRSIMKCAYCLPGNHIRCQQQLEIEPPRGRGSITSKSRRQLTSRRCQII